MYANLYVVRGKYHSKAETKCRLPARLAICSHCILSICNIYLFPALVLSRDVKSCQIRHPEVRIRYPDTSERSHRMYESMFAWYISDHTIAYMIFLKR